MTGYTLARLAPLLAEEGACVGVLELKPHRRGHASCGPVGEDRDAMSDGSPIRSFLAMPEHVTVARSRPRSSYWYITLSLVD